MHKHYMYAVGTQSQFMHVLFLLNVESFYVFLWNKNWKYKIKKKYVVTKKCTIS
jgi:hypothetical protein